MSQATVASYPPVPRREYLERLFVCCPGPELPSQFWTGVHARVQESLDCLETEVRRRLPEVRVEAGRTKGERVYLFTYRTFSFAGTGCDPVVAGIAFTPAQEGVMIEADVSGEETGDLILCLPPMTVAKTSEELRPAAQVLAEKLGQSAEKIVRALLSPSRIVP